MVGGEGGYDFPVCQRPWCSPSVIYLWSSFPFQCAVPVPARIVKPSSKNVTCMSPHLTSHRAYHNGQDHGPPIIIHCTCTHRAITAEKAW